MCMVGDEGGDNRGYISRECVGYIAQSRADAVGFDWLNLVLCLARAVVDAEAAANERLAAAKEAGAGRIRRPGQGYAGSKVGFQRLVNSRVRRQDDALIDVKDHLQIIVLPQRRIDFIPQSIVEGQVWPDLPLILTVTDVVLLLGKAIASSAVVERARRADVAVVL